MINMVFILGPFVEGLEYATGTKAEVVGKPEKGFFTSAIEDLHIGPEECVMIGDVSPAFIFLLFKHVLRGHTMKGSPVYNNHLLMIL